MSVLLEKKLKDELKQVPVRCGASLHTGQAFILTILDSGSDMRKFPESGAYKAP